MQLILRSIAVEKADMVFEEGEHSIGRGQTGCEPLRYDPAISRHHSTIIVTPGGRLMIQDENSLNGTLVNDQRIAKDEQIELKPGDLLQIGMTRLMVLRRD